MFLGQLLLWWIYAKGLDDPCTLYLVSIQLKHSTTEASLHIDITGYCVIYLHVCGPWRCMWDCTPQPLKLWRDIPLAIRGADGIAHHSLLGCGGTSLWALEVLVGLPTIASQAVEGHPFGSCRCRWDCPPQPPGLWRDIPLGFGGAGGIAHHSLSSCGGTSLWPSDVQMGLPIIASWTVEGHPFGSCRCRWDCPPQPLKLWRDIPLATRGADGIAHHSLLGCGGTSLWALEVLVGLPTIASQAVEGHPFGLWRSMWDCPS
ncbi:hypothetical protein EDD16DRAFT_1516579 [Pisolithus croceorrhizus]|nr:hypothetical protein EDD16DRAFT_1516579 [Pisolithus croceorrhizus]